MYDKDKIRIMSKMAVYDKRDFERDAKSGQYFRHDFIYKKNMQMRFFLGIGCVILLFFYVMHLLAIEGVDFFTVDFQAEALRLLFFALILMTAYSFIGTIIYTREFLRSERRMNAYFKLMRRLDPEAIEDDEPVRPTIREKQKKRWFKPRVEEIVEDEEDFEDYEEHAPYTHYHRANLEYRYRSSADPEFWEDDEDDKDARRDTRRG